ncbi:hypothetical protein BLA60_38030 [Actinophytocola xinjiangensis]|uniref:Uncharacterized protein n=1 Tax=Actinophytocola xinjiangensis TaxID=485602 RepID=A0A7Z0WDT3_9PSEU|nr:hypothetical protein [Actinophytocola xinjiangensis]OLF05037.1 hypothetical protein BLA60_38030 [Actinophytocola xinjiangensis]
MLRQRSRLWDRLRHRRAAGWLALALLYVVAAVLNVLLALDIGRWWPMPLVVALAGAAGACVVAALRRP